jgi:hypothetical protein
MVALPALAQVRIVHVQFKRRASRAATFRWRPNCTLAY